MHIKGIARDRIRNRNAIQKIVQPTRECSYNTPPIFFQTTHQRITLAYPTNVYGSKMKSVQTTENHFQNVP